MGTEREHPFLEPLQSKPSAPTSRRRWLLQAVPLTALFALLLSTLLPLLHVHTSQAQATLLHEDVSLKAPSSVLSVSVILAGVDTDANELATLIYINGISSTVGTFVNGIRKLSTTINLLVDGHVIVLAPETTNIWSPIPLKLRLKSGSIVMFPLDRYSTPLYVAANTVSTTNASKSDDLPVHLSVYQNADFNWRYSVATARAVGAPFTASTPPPGLVAIEAHRHPVFFSYIAILWLGIWVVTGSLLYIASMTMVWGRRSVENPMVYFSGLIAVPIFRNTAPGHPPYGCLFDVTSTYLAFAVILGSMLLASVLSLRPKPPQ